MLKKLCSSIFPRPLGDCNYGSYSYIAIYGEQWYSKYHSHIICIRYTVRVLVIPCSYKKYMILRGRNCHWRIVYRIVVESRYPVSNATKIQDSRTIRMLERVVSRVKFPAVLHETIHWSIFSALSYTWDNVKKNSWAKTYIKI